MRSCSRRDRKSTRLNSSHMSISYAVFCLKKKTRMCSVSLWASGPFSVSYEHSWEQREKQVRTLHRERIRSRRVAWYTSSLCFFFNDPATPEIYNLSLHDALPI